MKSITSFLLLSLTIVSLVAASPPHLSENWATTNAIAQAPPPDDSFLLGTVGGLPALVHLGTNTTIINNLVTNVTFITALTTNTTFLISIATNNTFVLTLVTNNQFNNFFNTNIFTNITVSQTFQGNKIQVNNLVITNAIAVQTNKWNGPTNTIDFNVYSQSYSSLTPINVPNFLLPTNAPEGQVLQQVSNISTTNWTATWPASVVAIVNGVIGATSATATNGTTLYFWWHYTPANAGARTNLVVNQL